MYYMLIFSNVYQMFDQFFCQRVNNLQAWSSKGHLINQKIVTYISVCHQSDGSILNNANLLPSYMSPILDKWGMDTLSWLWLPMHAQVNTERFRKHYWWGGMRNLGGHPDFVIRQGVAPGFCQSSNRGTQISQNTIYLKIIKDQIRLLRLKNTC